jgi:hypothetical protein
MRHFDLGDGVRLGIGHDTLGSEDSTESSEVDLGQNLGQRDLGQGFSTNKSDEIRKEQFDLVSI